MRLYGIPVTEEDCRTVVDLLLRVGRADDIAAAVAIEDGLSSGAVLIALPVEERDAILSVLVEPPEGLKELRGVLARDHQDRTQGPSSF